MKILIISSFLFLVSCAHSIHQSHTSDFKNMKPGSKLIESQAEQFSIMGFNTETEYVNKAFSSLIKQCPGRVTGITTRYSTSLGFFSWTNKVKMTGYCVSEKG
jgi:hypothetical protein